LSDTTSCVRQISSPQHSYCKKHNENVKPHENKNHFTIPGYDLCYTCHPDGTAHGGTAIIIKNTLEYYEGPKYAESTIQATSITVSGLFYKTTIAAVYCPPRHNLKEEQFKAFFQTLGPKFLAGGGDFNSKHTLWGSRLTTAKGRELAKLLQANNYYFISTGSPTYVGGSKIFRTNAVKTIKLTISPIGRRRPLSSSLPHVDTGPTVSSIFGTHPGSSFL